MPITNAAFYVHQAALGLQHAHERGMVHRDIKPNNLMLAISGKKHLVKILDFGLAKATSEEQLEASLTKSGQILGTPDYVAPEQTIDAHNADVRADIYSLGCTLYFLLTGKPPFTGKSLYEILRSHHTVQAKPVDAVRPEVPAGLAAVVARMMAKSPEERYQTLAEVAKALDPFFRGDKPAATTGHAGHNQTAVTMATGMEHGPAAVDAPPAVQPMDAISVTEPAGSNAQPAYGESMALSIVTNKAVKPKAPPRTSRAAAPPRNIRWAMAAAGGAAAIFLSVWVIVRNKAGEETARIQIPEGGSVVIQLAAGSTDVAAPPLPAAPTGTVVLSLPVVPRPTLTGPTPSSTADTAGTPVPEFVFLDDLQERDYLGRGSLGKRGHRQDLDSVFLWRDAPPKHALFTHPEEGPTNGTSRVSYVLSKRYQRFQGTVGLAANSPALLTFRILGDGKPLWTSQPVVAKDVGQDFDVDVSEIDVLQLEANRTRSNFAAHAVWVEPRLTTKTTVIAPPSVATTGAGTSSSQAQAFVPLFNGRDLAGWKLDPKSPGNWSVVNGAIVSRGSGPTYLYSNRSDYRDFELRAEVQFEDESLAKYCNGGIFVRAPFASKRSGFEIDLRGSSSADETGAICVNAKAVPQTGVSLHKPGEWFSVRILAVKKHLQVFVNDKPTAEYQHDQYDLLDGHIALQCWREGVIRFRNVEIRELSSPITGPASPISPSSVGSSVSNGNLKVSNSSRRPAIVADTLTFDGKSPLTVELWAKPDLSQQMERALARLRKTESAAMDFAPVLSLQYPHVDDFGYGTSPLPHIRSTVVAIPDRPAFGCWGAVLRQLSDYRISEQWQHLALVVVPSSDGMVTVTAWIDGKRAHTAKCELSGPVQVKLAVEFAGQLDQIRISKVVRYSTPFTPQRRFEDDESTLACYHCDEPPTATSLSDSSQGKHPAKISDASWITYEAIAARHDQIRMTGRLVPVPAPPTTPAPINPFDRSPAAFRGRDKNSDGAISEMEWIGNLAGKPAEDAREDFKTLDRDGDDRVTPAEFAAPQTGTGAPTRMPTTPAPTASSTVVAPAPKRTIVGPTPVFTGEGHGWIDGDKVVLESDPGQKAEIEFGDPAWTDYTLTATVLVEAAGADEPGAVCIMTRRQNKDTGWELEAAGAFAELWNQDLRLYKPGIEWHKHSTRRWLHKGHLVEIGKPFEVQIQLRGDDVVLRYDGKQIAQTSSFELRRGNVALKVYGPKGSKLRAVFSQIHVTSPSGATLWFGAPPVPVVR